MNYALPLVPFVARRFLSPKGLILVAGALALALSLPFSPSEVRGAGELSGAVSVGLERQGVWLTALASVLVWFAARAGSSVRQWRQGEGDWLGTSALSPWSIAWQHALGAALALAIALTPFALAGELRAGSQTPLLRWLADANVSPIALLTENDRATLSLEPPDGTSVAQARFVIAAPGSGGPSAIVRCRIERDGMAPATSETHITHRTSIDLEVRGGTGRATFHFERVGPGAVVVLEGPRLRWFAPRPARWSVALALLLHAWICGTAAAAIALGVAAWTSPGTAFLAAFAALAIPWLEDGASQAWPGVGLRDALELTGAGLGCGYPTLVAWTCCAVIVCVSPLLAALAPNLWRRES